MVWLPASALAAMVGWAAVRLGRGGSPPATRAVLAPDPAPLARDFLHLAAHELRGPVSVLDGYMSILEEGSLGKLPPRAAAAIPLVRAHARVIKEIADDLVETILMDREGMLLEKSDVDLGSMVQDAIRIGSPPPGSPHRVSLRLAPGPVFVWADPVRIRGVITHLIENAIKYSPGGGDVACTLEVVDGRAMVSVSDMGLGIEPCDLDRLFTRFGRLEGPKARGIPGTGLGLYLGREIARLHGGDLVVRSDPGKGTTFTLELAARLVPPQTTSQT